MNVNETLTEEPTLRLEIATCLEIVFLCKFKEFVTAVPRRSSQGNVVDDELAKQQPAHTMRPCQPRTPHDDSHFILSFISLFHSFCVEDLSLLISSLPLKTPLGPSESPAWENRPHIAKFNKPSLLMTTVTFHIDQQLNTFIRGDEHAQAHFSLFPFSRKRANKKEDYSTPSFIISFYSSCRQSWTSSYYTGRSNLADSHQTTAIFHEYLSRNVLHEKTVRATKRRQRDVHASCTHTHAIKHLK